MAANYVFDQDSQAGQGASGVNAPVSLASADMLARNAAMLAANQVAAASSATQQQLLLTSQSSARSCHQNDESVSKLIDTVAKELPKEVKTSINTEAKKLAENTQKALRLVDKKDKIDK